MALLYAAQLSPSKPELIAAWLPVAPYGPGAPVALERSGAYRFDDPAGEVGIETHLMRDADGVIYQVPLTYRSAPLDGARSVGEMEHSVLGRRYVYDATTDPVYVQQLLSTIYGGGREADQFLHVDGAEPRPIDNTTHATGSGVTGVEPPTVTDVRAVPDGTDTVIEAGGVTVVVHHRPVEIEPGGPVLLGEWDGGRGVLATLR
ncbi:CG0192-related protein [Rhodococcus sp. ACT016]|uniref:CG0192-related protein n=1 Tax=Rhodococcus sp. ACT016 TaxID=3134808 RepID=UPI003D2675FA